MSGSVTRWGAAFLALTVIGACMENGSNSPSTAPSNPTPSTAPPPTTSLSQPALLESTGELEPGFYKRPGFAPPIAFEVGAGWSAEQLFDGFFDVQMNPGSPDVVAVQFARPESIFGMNGESTPASAEEAVRILGENPDLDVLETSESRMSGLVGSQVTVENSGTAHASVMQVPPGALGIDPGRRLWIAFFDTEDGLLAIMVGGSVAEWDAALLAAEPVLESVVLGD